MEIYVYIYIYVYICKEYGRLLAFHYTRNVAPSCKKQPVCGGAGGRGGLTSGGQVACNSRSNSKYNLLLALSPKP